MSHDSLALIAKWEIGLFLIGLAAIIAYRLLNGKINTRYLLYGLDAKGNHYFSPLRIQLLVTTIGVAIHYLLSAAQASPGEMPKLPDGTLGLLGVSNAAYLGGKAFAFFKNQQ